MHTYKETFTMAVSRERFEQGMTYEQYKAQMTRNRDRLEDNERTAIVSDADIEFFKQLPAPINGLVLVEDWCGDVLNNVPVIVKAAEASGKINLRFLLRDQNLDIMDQYLNRGEFRSIPTVIFLDQDFRDIGHWIERPAIITELRETFMDGVWANSPELQGQPRGGSPAQLPEAARNRVMQASAEFRAQTRDQANSEVLREIRELLVNSLAAN
jgi:hypothetical protein